MLKALVSGGGLAGLCAAISLRRAGHIVHVYERSCKNNEIGAAINVPPNALRFLTAWGLDPVKWRFVKSRGVTFQDPFTMKTIAQASNERTAIEVGGTDLYYAHRVDLHNSLKWMATREDGPGTPVAIHQSSKVVGYDPSVPSITLASGETISGDVVIGADGVHSTASDAVIGFKNEPVAPEHSNYAFRFLIPADVLEEDPETCFWNQDRDGLVVVMPDHKSLRRIVTYPCRDNTIHNFVGLFYKESIVCETRENWKASVPVSEVLDMYSDFNPDLLKVISKATEVTKWPLLYRRPIPNWSMGRMALAGDAAHAMLPQQAQGGAQGLEDGVVLGMVLHGASSPEEIEKRLRIYENIRRDRASIIQILSNVGQDEIHLVHDELSQHMTPERLPHTPRDIYINNYGFNVVKETLRAMKEHDASYGLPEDFFEGEVIGVPGQ